jgi:glycosyltransferase involved in cell wall biosynthesis
VIRGKSIICFGGEDWWYHHPHSKNHLMLRFARAGNRVMFVNSISMGLPSLTSRDLLAKIKRKLSSYLKFVRQTSEGIVVVSPLTIPFYSSRACRFLNRFLLVGQVRLLMVAFDFRDPVLWIAIPTAIEAAGRLGEQALIYQVSDKYDANQWDHATSGQVIRAMHQQLIERADLVYFSGKKLYEEERRNHPAIALKLKLLEQAVDFEHFASATDARQARFAPGAPPDIEGIPHPRLGYFGAVDSWLIDQDLIAYVSGKRPDWHWIFIGLKASRLTVEDIPSVHYLGSKPYADMPRYAREFDVCVLPWSQSEWVKYGSAIKVREYLASGKPVVIVPLYEYEQLDGIVKIARSYDEFIEKVEESISCDNDSLRLARQEAVRRATWDVRAEEVSREIESLLSRDSRRSDIGNDRR